MSTIIVGSGITGMSAALLLAAQGEEVTILEAEARQSPLMRGFSRAGLHFDTGFHCAGGLERGGILRQWLQALGVWEYIGEEKLLPLREDFYFSHTDADKTENPDNINSETVSTQSIFSFAPTKEGLLPSIAAQFDAETAQEFASMLEEMEAVLAHSPYTDASCTRDPELNFSAMQSVHEKLQNSTLPPVLRVMLKSRCMLYGVTPEEASVQDYALVAGLYFRSSHALRGGGTTLLHAFECAIQKANIHIRCRARVNHIEQTNKRVTGVTLASGETISCTRCIFTGHPRQLTNIVDTGVFRSAFYHHLNEMTESMPAFMLFGETSNPYLEGRAAYLLPLQADEQLVVSMEENEPFVYLVGGDAPPNTEQNAAQNSSRSAHKRYPVMALVPTTKIFAEHETTGARSAEYRAWKGAESKRMCEYITRRLPELQDFHLLDCASPHTLPRWIYGAGTGLYGLAHNCSTLPLLPVTRMEGLFLAGQHILLPGILGCIISAALAVGFATGHSAALQEFRRCASNE